MSIQIKLKNSVVQDSTPSASDLPEVGELAVNGNINSIGGFMRASDNSIVKIFGPGSVTTPTATTTVSGISELATNSETTTGTATNRVVTPAGLNAVTVAERTTSNTNYVAKAGSTLTGVLTMPNGSNSAPAINFGDSDSGIFGGTNTVSLAAGGTTGLTFNASGQVNVPTRLGVGIASPLSLLHTKATNADNVFTLETATSGSPKITFNAAGAGGHTIGFDRSSAALTFTVAGGSERARIDSSGRLLVGHSSNFSISGANPRFQLIGGSDSTAHGYIGIFSANNVGANFSLVKSRNATLGSQGLVQDDDVVGNINFVASDGSDAAHSAAKISAAIDGTAAANDLPGRLVFSTTADGASSPTERLRIDSTGKATFAGKVVIDGDGGSKYFAVGDNEDFKIYHDANGPTIFSDPNNQGVKFQAKNLNFTESTGNTTRFRINDDGHVDVIGNLDVGAGLDVTGSINATTDITLASTSTGQKIEITKDGTSVAQLGHIGTGNEGFLALKDGGSNTVVLNGETGGTSYINAGNVGIGTTSPGTTLSVSGTVDGVLNLDTSDSRGAFVRFGQGGSFHNMVGCADGLTSGDKEDLGVRAADNIIFSSGGSTERMRITGDGPHLLLGGTADVNEITESSANAGMVIGGTGFGNAGLAIITSTSGTGRLYFGDSVGGNAGRNVGQINYGHSDNHMRFITNSSERLRIDSSGNVGIGTTSPAQLLSLRSADPRILLTQTSANSNAFLDAATSGVLEFSADDNNVASNSSIRFKVDGSERMRIDKSGRVGINGSSTKGMLEVRASGGATDQLTAVFGANEGTTDGTLTDNTDKACRIGVQHYDTDAKPFTFLVGSGTSGSNTLNIGGGTSLMNSATNILFSTDSGTINNGGSERMRIDSSGFVGIGLSNPDQLLHIYQQSGSSQAYLHVQNNRSRNAAIKFTTTQGSWLVGQGIGNDNDRFAIYDTSEKFVIDSAGNVGIGTTAPSELFTVNGADKSVLIRTSSATGTAKLKFEADGTNYGGVGLENTAIVFRCDNASANNERMRIDSSGRVGIGTTSPSSFNVYGDNFVVASSTDTGISVSGNDASTNFGSLMFSAGTTVRGYLDQQLHSTGRTFLMNRANGFMGFGTNNLERMRIDNVGSVGLGTSSPGFKLHVLGGIVDQTAVFDNSKTADNDINYIGVRLNGGGKGVAIFGHTGHSTAASQAAWMGLGGDDVAGGRGVKVFKGGNVVMMQRLLLGISNGTNNVSGSDATFQISYQKTFRFGMHIRPSDNDTGGGQPVIFQNQAGTTIGSISATASGITYNETSDYRLKENDVAILDGITRLKKLRPIRFNWKTDAEKTQDGFFAHEVSEAVPEAVTGEKDGTQMQQMDNSKLVPLLVAAVQELIGRVEKLEAA